MKRLLSRHAERRRYGRLLGEVLCCNVAVLHHWRRHRSGLRITAERWGILIELARFLLGCFSILNRRVISQRSSMIEEILTPDSRHQCLVRCIMEVLGLLSNAIMASILKSAFDASLARPLITLQRVSLISLVTTERSRQVRSTRHTTCQMRPLAGKTRSSRFFPSWT